MMKQKKLAVLAFTGRGQLMAEQLIQKMKASKQGETEWQISLRAPARLERSGWKGFSNLKEVMEELFCVSERPDIFLFVGAMGIAVRAIAPHITDKLRDPAVLVMDEAGGFVIPVLGGHAGGANEFAVELAELAGAQPVITTATDVNGVFSVDSYARKNYMAIVEKDEIKHISGAILEGRPVGVRTPEAGFVIAPAPEGRPFDHTLHLVPQDLVVGMGCRKGTPVQKLQRFLEETFEAHGWSLYRIRALASAEMKRAEPGLAALAQNLRVPFLTYSTEILQAQQGRYSASAFVRETTGTDNVCERSAMAAAVSQGWLAQGARFDDYCCLEKQACDGMTLAVLALSSTSC